VNVFSPSDNRGVLQDLSFTSLLGFGRPVQNALQEQLSSGPKQCGVTEEMRVLITCTEIPRLVVFASARAELVLSFAA